MNRQLITRSVVTALVILVAGSCGKKTEVGEARTEPATVAPGATTASEVPPTIAKAVAASWRPEKERARDANRRPGEVLAFFGVEPGMTVAELMTGRGYYIDILSGAVGPAGRVYAQNNKFVVERFADKAITERLKNPELANVVRWDRELDALGFEVESLDGVVMILFYHDTIWQKVDRAAMNAGVFAALEPGGFFGVIDHVAAPRSGDVSNTLHRIETAQIIAEVTAAGFVLDEQSDILHHPEDDHTRNVFDPAIRGRTDRAILRFRKPKKQP